MSLIECTGSKTHLRKLTAVTGSLKSLKTKGPFPTEESFYGKFGLMFMEPELREGHDEVQRAAEGTLPVLVTVKDVRRELHAHSTSSDGSHSIEQMAAAAKGKGYEYLGITDHSQSLKIARGVSVDDLWKQIRYIDKLNERLKGFRVLKSSEVDILLDGSLDYPDDLLRSANGRAFDADHGEPIDHVNNHLHQIFTFLLISGKAMKDDTMQTAFSTPRRMSGPTSCSRSTSI